MGISRVVAPSVSLAMAVVVSLGCGADGDKDGTSPSLCEMHPVEPCTENCIWDEVLHHKAYCADCIFRNQLPSYTVADCGDYNLFLSTGIDAGSVRYYDRATGALVGEMVFGTGTACEQHMTWPGGCEQAEFAALPSWCEGEPVCAAGDASASGAPAR